MEDEPRATANGRHGRKRAKGCGAASYTSSQSEHPQGCDQEGHRAGTRRPHRLSHGVSFSVLISPPLFLGGVKAPAQWALTVGRGCDGESLVVEGCSEMLRDAMGCHGMLWDAMRCNGMLWDAMGCYGMPWDAMGCDGMLWDVIGCHGMLWDVMRCHGMPRDAMGCHGMLQAGLPVSKVSITPTPPTPSECAPYQGTALCLPETGVPGAPSPWAACT